MRCGTNVTAVDRGYQVYKATPHSSHTDAVNPAVDSSTHCGRTSRAARTLRHVERGGQQSVTAGTAEEHARCSLRNDGAKQTKQTDVPGGAPSAREGEARAALRRVNTRQ